MFELPKSTRRGMLGIAAAIPVFGLAVSTRPSPARRPDAARWNAMLETWKKAASAHEAGGFKDDDALGELELVAWRQLIMSPAPHRTALLWKMEYLWGSTMGEEAYCDSWSVDIVHAVMRDARRLLMVDGGEAPNA